MAADAILIYANARRETFRDSLDLGSRHIQLYDYSKKLFLCNAQIKMEKFTKFLGVIIDQNLNWKKNKLFMLKRKFQED